MKKLATSKPEDGIIESKSTLTLIARDPTEMQNAQEGLRAWADAKLAEEQAEYDDLATSLVLAKKNKWNTAALKRQATRALKRVEYYEKAKAAIFAGYALIPNFPVDVFAIRTSLKKPKKDARYGRAGSWMEQPRILADCSPFGKGRYVSDEPETAFQDRKATRDKPGTGGKEKEEYIRRTLWASDFDPVQFPLLAVKPELITAGQLAMAKNVFDEMGIMPERRRRCGDPLIVGRIVRRNPGYMEDTVMTFLIAWFVDVRTL